MFLDTTQIQNAAKKLNEWYIDACEEIETKPKKLTKSQEAINRILARKIIENVMKELTISEDNFDNQFRDSDDYLKNFIDNHIYLVAVFSTKQNKFSRFFMGRKLKIYKKDLGEATLV